MGDDVRTLVVIDQTGKRHTVEGLDGWRVMEIVRDQGLPIKAECGGACACGTCHVYVDAAWLAKLYPKTAEEDDRLAEDAFAVEANSRLSCQILMSPVLDGLVITLAPGTEPV
jgi:ferredoxin, 2Fe-2S